MAEAKTQAVGAIGGVLLAAGGTAAAIGIYEAQEHHSAVGWFTCCAACFIAATLIPIITFVFLPWVEHLGAKQMRTLQATPTVPNDRMPSANPGNEISLAGKGTPHSMPPLPDGRIVINATPRFLAEYYQGHKTDIEAETAVQRYLGKWIQVNGILDNMYFGGGPNGKDTLFVRLVEEDVPIGELKNINAALKRLSGITATLIFTERKWIDQLTAFNQGDSITAIGKLDSIDRGGVRLENCELVTTA